MARAAKSTTARGETAAQRNTGASGDSADLAQLGVMGKALTILEIVAGSHEPVAISSLVRISGLTKPTAHRIAGMLSEMGFIEREPTRRGFVVGPRLIAVSLQTLSAAASRNIRRAILRELSETIGETCNFGVLAGAEVVYLDRVEAKWPLGLRFEAGSRVPAHCTALGKLLIAHLPDRERREVISTMPLTRYTGRTFVDREALEAAVARIAESKVGIDDQEFIDGVVCVSVPVTTPQGEIVGGIAMSAPEARVSLDQALGHVPRMREAARRLGETYRLSPEE